MNFSELVKLASYCYAAFSFAITGLLVLSFIVADNEDEDNGTMDKAGRSEPYCG